MAPTLKERYDQRQLQLLRERTKKVDAQLLVEQKAAQLIIEAMDPEDLQKVGAIVQKLDTLKSPELPHLTQAIEQAQAELNKYTGGGPITQAWTKLKGLVGIDNPVVKITTFADALERGMSQIPQILKNNGVDLAKADLNKSLTSLLTQTPTGKNGDEGGAKSTSNSPDKVNPPGDNAPKPMAGAKSDAQLGNTSFGGKGGEDHDIPGPKTAQAPSPPNVTGTRPEPEKADYAGDVAKAAGRPPAQAHAGGQDKPPKRPTGKAPLPAKNSTPPADQNESQLKEDEVTSDEDPNFNPKISGGKAPVNGDAKLKNIVAQIRKALAPGGLFGAFKQIPYINGSALAQELIQAPIKVFANVSKRVQQGAKASEIAVDMKQQIQGQGSEQTKHANTAEPAQPAGQSQPGQPAKPTTATTDTTGAGQKTPNAPGDERGGGKQVQTPEPPQIDHKKVRGVIARMLKNQDPETFVNALTKAGLKLDQLPGAQPTAAGPQKPAAA